MQTYIWRILHKPTGLFYCSRKGRFYKEKTNLSEKGNFYLQEKQAQKVFKEDLYRADINKAQAEKYGLDVIKEDREYQESYGKASPEDFEIKKYVLMEVEN